MTIKLDGKRALVTGGSSGIGIAIVRALAEAGAKVAVNYNTHPESAEELAQSVKQAGGEAFAVQADVSDPAAVAAMFQRLDSAWGGIDILINNAGRFETEALERITLAQWDEMFSTNTRGPFLVARHAYPHLKRSHGRIVNIGSLGGIHPWSTHAHYCTSKAAVHMLSQCMAKAWAPEISVNCVAPGLIVTSGDIPLGYQHFAEKTPMKRNGTVEDVAAAVLFFVTGPHFITGQILTVDGGLGL